MDDSIRSIAATIAVFFAVGGAAADGAERRLQDAPACSQRFQGFYAGSHLGFGQYTSQHNDLDGYLPGNSAYTSSDRAVLAGPHVGYNYQPGCHTLFGIEADWSGTTLEPTARFNPNAAVVGTDQHVSNGLRNLGTIRVRSGLILENTVLYLTGGLAVAKFETAIRNAIPEIQDEQFSSSDTRVGWTAGAGTEWSLGRNVSMKAEVLYMAFGEKTTTFLSSASARNFTFKTDDSLCIARLGVNIRLGNSSGTAAASPR